jgi:regulator of protease activity HflC (stomatin/prohibitin superfamily)
MAGDASKDGFGPASAWAQSAELSFQGLFILVFLLAAGWAVSNCRQVPPESRAVVLRFGTVVRQVGAGLLVALPQPFEHVIILPSPDRQIEFKVSAFRPSEGADRFFTQERVANSTALPPAAVSDDPRQNTGMLLTGDMSVVHFDATLFYQITDANSYVLSSEHVAPGLTRLFVASAVAISARRDLDTILVARPELNTSTDTARAGRESLRADLMAEVNRRLTDLVGHGAGLGIRVSRVDLVPSIPVEAKSAFDAVLYALQEAETVTASARTEAETTAQKANQDKDRILTDAQAMAQERVTQAKTRTATITALAQAAKGLSADMVSKQLYQERVGKLLGQAGKVFTTDGAGSARLIVPGGKQP